MTGKVERKGKRKGKGKNRKGKEKEREGKGKNRKGKGKARKAKGHKRTGKERKGGTSRRGVQAILVGILDRFFLQGYQFPIVCWANPNP